MVYHTTPTTLKKVRPNLTDYREGRWKRITDYEHLHSYLRDLYQTGGVAGTVNMEHIVEHYGSPGSPDGFGPHPAGSINLGLEEPHARGE